MSQARTAAAAAALLVLLTGCIPPTSTTAAPSAPVPAGASAPGHVPGGTLDAAAARARLAELRTAAPGGMAGYVRDCDKAGGCVFGQPWADTDRDGCDQRSQVLARDLADVVRKPGRCAVTGGQLTDPYTGKTLTKVSAVQVDHVVPLAEMWRTGAAAWTTEHRTAAANDLRNLLAVDGKVNQAKGDKPPDRWLPPRAEFHCPYARIYVTVKSAYQLTTTRAERSALEKALATCP